MISVFKNCMAIAACLGSLTAMLLPLQLTSSSPWTQNSETTGPLTATAEWAGCVEIARIEVDVERNIRTSPSKLSSLNLNKTIFPGSQEIAINRVANDEGEWYQLCSRPNEKLRWIYTSDRSVVSVFLTATRTPSPQPTPTRLTTATSTLSPSSTPRPTPSIIHIWVNGADIGVYSLQACVARTPVPGAFIELCQEKTSP